MQTVSLWFVLLWLYHLFLWMHVEHSLISSWWRHQMETFPALLAGDQWIPRTKASDADLWCFLWSAPWINCWVYNREAVDLRRQRAHCDGRHFNVSGSLYLCGIVTNSSEVTMKHWIGNFIILIKSLTALEVVKMTTSSTASDGNFVTLKIFPFQWGQFNTE